MSASLYSNSPLLVFCANLTPILGSVLLYTTLLLGVGFVAAFLVGQKRLGLLSLLYRSLLVGSLLLSLVALTPSRENESLLRVSLPAYATPQPPSIESLTTTDQSNAPITATVSHAAALPLNTENSEPSLRTPSSCAVPSLSTRTEPTPSPYNTQKPNDPLLRTTSASSDETKHRIPLFALVVGALWFCGAALKLGWLLVGQLSALRLRRQSHDVEDESALLVLQQESARLGVTAPQLLTHPRVQVPFLFGLWQPTVVLPANYSQEFQTDALRVVFAHELSHLIRRDCWWKNAALIVGALLWMQPLLLFLRRRMEVTDEALCDAAVLRGGCSPRHYADVLLTLAERGTCPPRGQMTGVGIVTFRSALGRRVQRIMDSEPSGNSRLPLPVRVVMVAAIWGAIVCVPRLISLKAASQTPPGQLKEEDSDVAQGLPATLEEAQRQAHAIITGRVIYSNGRPAVGLKVLVTSKHVSDIELWGYKRQASNSFKWPADVKRLFYAEASTHSDGTYRVSGLLPQDYRVNLTATHWEDRAPQGWVASPDGVNVKPVLQKIQTAPDIVLQHGAIVKIHVVDQDSSMPLQGILCRAFNLDESERKLYSTTSDAHRNVRHIKPKPITVETDSQGLSALTLDAGKAYFYIAAGFGRYIIRARHDGIPPFGEPYTFITQQGVYKAEEWYQVVTRGQATRKAWKGETAVTLKRGQTIDYTIRLKKLRALTPDDRALLRQSSLTAQKAPKHKKSWVKFPADWPESFEEAQKRANATVTGRVLYDNGKPVVGVHVSVYSDFTFTSSPPVWGYARTQANQYRLPDAVEKLLQGDAVTRADGTYRVTGLLPLRYGVTLSGFPGDARAPEGWIAPNHYLGVNAVSKQSRRAPDFVLQRGATIRVRVLDQTTGSPLKDLRCSGFTLAENNGRVPTGTARDAHDAMRPSKYWALFNKPTDVKGYCVLTFSPGYAYFYLEGGGMMQMLRRYDPKSKVPLNLLPMGMMIGDGLYPINAWHLVVAPGQSPRRAWKGETKVQVIKGQRLNYTIRLKRSRDLTAPEKYRVQNWPAINRQIWLRGLAAKKKAASQGEASSAQQLAQARRDLNQAQQFFQESYVGRLAQQVQSRVRARQALQVAQRSLQAASSPTSTLLVRDNAISLVQAAVKAVQVAQNGRDTRRPASAFKIPRFKLPSDWPQSFEEAQQRANTTLTGRVLYEDGKPVVGVTVTFYSQFTNIDMDASLWGYRRTAANEYTLPKSIERLFSAQAVTDTTGTYHLANLWPARYGLGLYRDDATKRITQGWTESSTFVGTEAVATGVSRMPNYVLKRGATVRIRVVDRATEKPLPGIYWTGYTQVAEDESKPQSRGRDAAGESRTFIGWTHDEITDANGYCTLTFEPGKTYCYMEGGGTGGLFKTVHNDPKYRLLAKYRWWPHYLATSQGSYLWPNWCKVTSPGAAPRREWCGQTEVELKKGESYNMTLFLEHTDAVQPGDEEFLKLHLKSRPL